MAFSYKEDDLFVDHARINDIVEKTNTPVYIYSLKQFINNFKAYQCLSNSLICFAVKSNPNLSLLHAIARENGGADVTSMGEMKLALAAGIAPAKIVFSGVGKTPTEIEFAIQQQIHQINAESIEELECIDATASRLNQKINVSLRVNPDIDAETHYKITTGKNFNKFGISEKQILAIELEKYPNVDLIGIASHVGSAINSLSVFSQMVSHLKSMGAKLEKQGWNIQRLDVGGGLGIAYSQCEICPSIAEYVALLEEKLGNCSYQIICEPGRAVSGNCGILVSKVLYIKSNQDAVKHVILDAGMNDLVRPAMYGATHHIMPVKRDQSLPVEKVDIVGPVCETGDTFAHDFQIQQLKSGQLVCICDAGAYGMSLCSSYNSRLTPAEVLVNGDKFMVVRERDTFESLLRRSKVCESTFYNT